MRRAVFALASICLFSPLTAHANAEVTPAFYGVVAPINNDTSVNAAIVCEGRAARATSTVSVTCSIDDGNADAGTSNTCSSPGPEALCYAYLVNGIFPVNVCAVATATLADLTTSTDSHCRLYTPPTS